MKLNLPLSDNLRPFSCYAYVLVYSSHIFPFHALQIPSLSRSARHGAPPPSVVLLDFDPFRSNPFPGVHAADRPLARRRCSHPRESQRAAFGAGQAALAFVAGAVTAHDSSGRKSPDPMAESATREGKLWTRVLRWRRLRAEPAPSLTVLVIAQLCGWCCLQHQLDGAHSWSFPFLLSDVCSGFDFSVTRTSLCKHARAEPNRAASPVRALHAFFAAANRFLLLRKLLNLPSFRTPPLCS